MFNLKDNEYEPVECKGRYQIQRGYDMHATATFISFHFQGFSHIFCFASLYHQQAFHFLPTTWRAILYTVEDEWMKRNKSLYVDKVFTLTQCYAKDDREAGDNLKEV